MAGAGRQPACRGSASLSGSRALCLRRQAHFPFPRFTCFSVTQCFAYHCRRLQCRSQIGRSVCVRPFLVPLTLNFVKREPRRGLRPGRSCGRLKLILEFYSTFASRVESSCLFCTACNLRPRSSGLGSISIVLEPRVVTSLSLILSRDVISSFLGYAELSAVSRTYALPGAFSTTVSLTELVPAPALPSTRGCGGDLGTHHSTVLPQDRHA